MAASFSALPPNPKIYLLKESAHYPNPTPRTHQPPCHNPAVRTEAQIEASRANGSKSRGPITEEGKLASAANAAFSTGPRTPEGKARCARNAVKHELLVQSLVLPNEKIEEFLEILTDCIDYLHPVGPMEERQVENIAAAQWRQRRTWCLETARIAHATLVREQAGDEFANRLNQAIPSTHSALGVGDVAVSGHGLELVRKYEIGFSREYLRGRAELRTLQAERRERESESPKQTEPKPAPDPIEVDPDPLLSLAFWL
jgi:hypothetical protein